MGTLGEHNSQMVDDIPATVVVDSAGQHATRHLLPQPFPPQPLAFHLQQQPLGLPTERGRTSKAPSSPVARP